MDITCSTVTLKEMVIKRKNESTGKAVATKRRMPKITESQLSLPDNDEPLASIDINQHNLESITAAPAGRQLAEQSYAHHSQQLTGHVETQESGHRSRQEELQESDDDADDRHDISDKACGTHDKSSKVATPSPETSIEKQAGPAFNDTNRRDSQGDYVFSLQKRLGDRGRSTPGKSRAGQNTKSYECVRTLIRMGVLPAISAFDDLFLRSLIAIVNHHDRRCGHLAGSPVLDAFHEIRFREADGQISLPSAVCRLERNVFNKFVESQVIWSALMRAGRPAMFRMTMKLLGTEPSEHKRIVAQNFDALEAIRSGQLRMLLLADTDATPSGLNPKLASSRSELHERCLFGLKLLCIVYAGIIAVFQSSWNDCYRIRSLQKKLLPETYAMLTKFEADWSADSIRSCLFSPACFLDPDDPSTVGIPLIGSHLERLCTVQLDSIMQMTEAEVARFRGQDCASTVTGPNTSFMVGQVTSSAVEDTHTGSQTRSDDKQSETRKKRWDVQRQEPPPWNEPVAWHRYLTPILPDSEEEGSAIHTISAYERDFRLINEFKEYILQCDIGDFALAGVNETHTNDQAIDMLINEMRRLVMGHDELERCAAAEYERQAPKKDSLMRMSSDGVISVWKHKLNVKLREREEADDG
jgi:hypothetical protein